MTCIECGKEFEFYGYSRKRCYRCHSKHVMALAKQRQYKKERVCPTCGKTFHSESTSPYCCKECRPKPEPKHLNPPMAKYDKNDRIDVEIRCYGNTTARYNQISREKARRMYYKAFDEGDHAAVIFVNGTQLRTIRDIEGYLGGTRSKSELTIPMTFATYGYYGNAKEEDNNETD